MKGKVLWSKAMMPVSRLPLSLQEGGRGKA